MFKCECGINVGPRVQPIRVITGTRSRKYVNEAKVWTRSLPTDHGTVPAEERTVFSTTVGQEITGEKFVCPLCANPDKTVDQLGMSFYDPFLKVRCKPYSSSHIAPFSTVDSLRDPVILERVLINVRKAKQETKDRQLVIRELNNKIKQLEDTLAD